MNNPDGLSAPSPELIRQELARVLNTKTFATSARSSRVLSYVTEKTLAGSAMGSRNWCSVSMCLNGSAISTRRSTFCASRSRRAVTFPGFKCVARNQSRSLALDSGRLAVARRHASAAIDLADELPIDGKVLLGAFQIQVAIYIELNMQGEALALVARLKAPPVESAEQSAVIHGLAGACCQVGGAHRRGFRTRKPWACKVSRRFF